MMNELALHDEIQQFNGVALQLNCYRYLVEGSNGNGGGVMDGFLTCLNHENSDVAMSVVGVCVVVLMSRGDVCFSCFVS